MNPRNPTLTRETWLLAGFAALALTGTAALKAERLARDLKTTKGSFYWHFKDVPTFQAAMLTYWRAKATDEIIAMAGATDSSSRQDLYALVDVLSQLQGESNNGARVEAAIRQWAASDDVVFQAVKSVDKVRIDHLAHLLAGSGLAEGRAQSAAKIVYGALIGLQHLELMQLADTRIGLRELLARMVGTLQ